MHIEKVPGSENISDVGTKHLDGPTLNKLLKLMGVEFAEGRAETAPELVDQANDAKKVKWEDQSSAKKKIIEPNHKTTAHSNTTLATSTASGKVTGHKTTPSQRKQTKYNNSMCIFCPGC